MKKYLFIAFALALAGSAKATSYYVSDCGSGAASQCVAGDDANSGTSPAAPWKTCAQVTAKFPSLLAGDQVLFARGSAQTACKMLRLANYNSKRDNPIVIGAYTPPWAAGTPPNPILNGAATDHTLEFFNGGYSIHDEGYVVQDLHMVGVGITTTNQAGAIFLYNDVQYVTIQRVELEQYVGGIHCNGGTSSKGDGSTGISEHIVIRNSYIHNNRGTGLMGSCNDMLIENNRFDSNGLGAFDHQIYLDDSTVNGVLRVTNQVVVRGNTLTNNTPYASATSGDATPGTCASVALVMHGAKKGITIENNLISEPVVPLSMGCWGIEADTGGYPTAEGFTNVVIRGNTVVNYAMGIGVGMCDTCTIENNSIYTEKAGAQGVAAPAVYYRAATAGNLLNNKLTVRNNSVYLKNPTYESVGIRIVRDGSNHSVVSNLVYFGSGSTADTACFNTAGLTPASFSTFDYNLCYFSANGGSWDSTRTSLSAQQAAGLDKHSLTSNPNVPTPAAPLFLVVPGSGSPAIHAGHPTLSAKLSHGGLKRSTAPDIGAREFSGTAIVPSSPTSLGVQ